MLVNKKLLALAVLALLTAGLAFPQSSPFNVMSVSPQGPNSVFATVTGTPGTTVYYYWVVAVYTGGKSAPAGPFQLNNSNATLSSTNFNVVNFTVPNNPIATPTGYDVLRTTTQTPPTGACACAVATAQAGTPVNDQSNTLNAYTVATLVTQYLEFIDNVNSTNPSKKVAFGGVASGSVLPFLKTVVMGPFAAAAAGNFTFAVDANYVLAAATATIAVQASAGCTWQVEVLTGTTAPASGTNQLTAAFNFQTQAINTVTGGTLIATPTNIPLGARLGLVQTGACTTLANAYITLTLRQVN